MLNSLASIELDIEIVSINHVLLFHPIECKGYFSAHVLRLQIETFGFIYEIHVVFSPLWGILKLLFSCNNYRADLNFRSV